MADKYCSAQFKTGEELDEALKAALDTCDYSVAAAECRSKAEEHRIAAEEAAEKAWVSGSDAERRAEVARDYAGKAEEAFLQTQELYQNAEDAAVVAKNKAKEAEASAQAASEAAGYARTMMEEAQGAADQAAQNAKSTTTDVTRAQNAADSAYESAVAAGQSAAAAETAAKSAEAAATEAQSAVRGDWEQNDEAGVGYIKNRTHWKEILGTDREVIPEQSVTLSILGYQYIPTANAVYGGLEEGCTYIVTFNGTEYECVCQNDEGMLYVGNPALYSGGSKPNTGEPFAITNRTSSSKYAYTLYMNEADGGSTVTVKMVEKQTTVYHKLDKNFMPDDFEGGVSSWNDLTDKPFAVEKSIKWDGDTTGLTWIQERTSGDRFWGFKVSGELPNREELIGGYVEYHGDDFIPRVYQITADMIVDTAWGEGYMIASDSDNQHVVVVSKPTEEMVEAHGITPGTYFHSASATAEQGIRVLRWGESKRIDASALPYGYPTFDVFREIVPETTLNEANAEALMMAKIPLTVGKAYCIRWDGIDYYCAAQAVVVEGFYMGVGIGNLALVGGGNSGEPFFIMASSDEAVATGELPQTLFYALDEREYITFSIRDGKFNAIHVGYLPKMVVNFSDVAQGITTDCTADKTFAEVVEAINKGWDVEAQIKITDIGDSQIRVRLPLLTQTLSEDGISISGVSFGITHGLASTAIFHIAVNFTDATDSPIHVNSGFNITGD